MIRMLKSFGYAFRGIFLLIKSERNFQIHLFALALVISAGFYFDIKKKEWIAILLISALVLSMEAMNSALEKMCNEITTERRESIRNIKDIAAGAVLISVIIAVIVGVKIFWKYVF